MRHLVFILISLVFTACSDSGKEKKITAFEETCELTAEVVTSSIPFLVPRYMGISGDNLFIHKVREEKMFSIYSLPDLKHLGDDGRRGQGPHDFNLLDTRSFQITQDGFKVIDANLNMQKEVEIADGRLIVNKSKFLFRKGMVSNGFYPFGEGRYVVFAQPDSKNEFALFDENTGEFIPVEGEYPHWQEISKEAFAFMTYLKTCVSHPNGKRFAAFYGRFKRWRLFDESLNMIKDIDVKVKPYQADATLNPEKQPTYYIGQPYATDKHIYVLCSNKNTEKDGRSELQVWDWDGNALACYTFDRKLSLMAISEKYNKIYGVDNMIEDKIFVYNLPK